MKYISFFKNIDKSATKQFGGKAASLGEMKKAGIPVPNGFAISTAAFKEFSDGKISRKLKEEIEKAFDELGVERVAVRSSAVAEDAIDASWAGQLESYLNISKSGLSRAVRKCWDSIEAERAILYAQDKDIADDSRLVGVVVQAMVDSEKSGVMFTVDPVSKDDKKMIIESAYGLGEMVVQGSVTPDNYVLSKNPFKVLDFNISIKEKQMLFQAHQNRTVNVPEDLADKATLREEEVLELAKVGMKIEKHYMFPQDIEWAYEKGEFFIVQSRPITTL